MCSNDTADRRRVMRLAAGDRLALRELYEAHFSRLVVFFSSLTDAPVDDLINDTWLDVWRHKNSVNANEPSHVWITRRALSRMRQRPPKGLPLEYAVILLLVYTGHTRPEVAAILDIPEAGIDFLLGKARRACPNLKHSSVLSIQKNVR